MCLRCHSTDTQNRTPRRNSVRCGKCRCFLRAVPACSPFLWHICLPVSLCQRRSFSHTPSHFVSNLLSLFCFSDLFLLTLPLCVSCSRIFCYPCLSFFASLPLPPVLPLLAAPFLSVPLSFPPFLPLPSPPPLPPELCLETQLTSERQGSPGAPAGNAVSPLTLSAALGTQHPSHSWGLRMEDVTLEGL